MLNSKHRLGRGIHRAIPENVTIRPATLSDCTILASRLRAEDEAEVSAGSGLPAEYAMKLGLLNDPAVSVACIDGQPEMIFGCSGDDLTGQPWMLATPLPFTPKWSRVFLRASADVVENDWQARFPILTNFVDARNESHIRWLRWLGFVFIRRDPLHGVAGIPFLEFVRINTNV